jgi:membrane protease YdiL (CAAX protease family)
MTSGRRLRVFKAIIRTLLVGLLIPGFLIAAVLIVPPDYVRLTFILPVLLAFFLIRKDFKSRLIIKDRVSVLTVSAVVIGPAAAVLCTYYASQYLTRLIQNLALPELPFPLPFSEIPAASRTTLFFLAVILAPIVEEIWYRELTLKEALKGLNKVFACILSSILFALPHFSLFNDWKPFLIALPGYFFMGLVLSMLRLTYGLLFAVVSHSGNNLFNVFIDIPASSPFVNPYTAICLLAAFLYSVSRSTRKPKDAEQQKLQEPSTPEEKH